MSLGTTKLVRENYVGIVDQIRRRAEALFEEARAAGQAAFETATPVDTGALKRSSEAKPLEAGFQSVGGSGADFPSVIGFVLRSFGDDDTGKGYARWVNGGHHTSSGSWVPANPYFSQAEMDALSVIRSGRKKLFAGLK